MKKGSTFKDSPLKSFNFGQKEIWDQFNNISKWQDHSGRNIKLH